MKFFTLVLIFGSAWNAAFGQNFVTNFYTVSTEDFAKSGTRFFTSGG